jgi:hypothetical protein
LKFNPVTGMVWALQNNDANAMLSLINPTTGVVAGPLKYAAPPYAYGNNPPPPPANPPFNNGRGYDDVAFLNGNVYLSYTNPTLPTDSVLQVLDQRARYRQPRRDVHPDLESGGRKSDGDQCPRDGQGGKSQRDDGRRALPGRDPRDVVRLGYSD